MNLRSRRLPSAPFGVGVPGVLVAGVVLSLLLFLHLRERERREIAEAAAEVTRRQVEHLHVSILRSMEVLHSVAALHAAHGDLDRSRFRDFVRAALDRQPELQALSWNPVVPRAERARWETAAREEGLAGFGFVELGPEGRLQPAGSREEYVPVYLIEPRESNEAALGFDLASDASRRRSLEQAWDSALPIATAPVRLAQGPIDTAGILVVLPVFRGSLPEPPEERRRPIAGYAVAVFRVPDLVDGAFRELRRLGIEAELFDEPPGGDRLFALEGAGTSGRAPREGTEPATALLEVAGRRWAVVFAPTPAFVLGRGARSSPWVLAAGLAFTLSTCGHLFHAARRAREIDRANAALREEVAVRQRAEAEAEAANKAKSDFLTRMSHEIRTPLNAMLGYAQIMERDERLPRESRDAAHGIQTGGQHLLGLINEVLDLAKIEAGRMELRESDFDLDRLARDIATTFRPLCFQKGLAFRLQGPAGGGRRGVRGDEGKLRQVLINLVGNAIKFTRVGEVQLLVRSAEDPPIRWSFEVLDTGLGIPESERADIFKPFHQGSGSGHQGGTGLGLAIARRQVELLGGTLRFESERGVGSRFHFRIPLPPASGPVLEPAAPASVADAGLAEPPCVPEPPPLPVSLPAALLARLNLAAELHSSTAMKAGLEALGALGPEAARLAEEIRWLLRSYDMRGIQKALGRARAEFEPTAAADSGDPVVRAEESVDRRDSAARCPAP